jgi:uncharacterized protein (DUF697 family)
MDDEQGKKLLTAVERILASNAAVKTVVAECEARAKAQGETLKGDSLREATAQELVRHYSNRAAIAGGAAGLPALIPGWGSLVAAVGGTFAELTLLLKWEVEMALALSHLYDFDIDKPTERQLAFLAASVGTYDATGRSFVGDVLRLEGTALWNYGPRRIARLLVQALAALAAAYLWRGFIKAIPVLGMIVGSSVNKVLTKKVGDKCLRDLRTRRDLMSEQPAGGAPPRAKAKAKAKKKPARKKPARREPPAETLN